MKKIKTIVCLGDSITCNWADPSYVNFWQGLFEEKAQEVKVIAAGINGETAQDGYYRLDRDVVVHKPDVVTIMFGHNDADPARNISPVLFANYLRKTINYLKHTTDAEIWLLTPNQLGDSQYNKIYEPYLQMIEQAAKDKQVYFVDLFHAFQSENLDLIFTYKIESTYIRTAGKDWIHPNEKGQKILAKRLMEEYEKTLNY